MNFNVLSIDIDWCQSHFHIEQMNKVFYENMCTAKRIVFSHHHHQIVPEIIHEDNIVLHNIDHHHDIQYDDWQVNDIEKVYIKFKKYDVDTFEIIGQVSKNVDPQKIDEEFLVELKIEIDSEFGNEDEFEIET